MRNIFLKYGFIQSYRDSSIKYMLFMSPNLERQSDHICKWTGVCPEG